MDVAVGVDAHKSTLAVAAVDRMGRLVAAAEFDNHPSGHLDLKRWLGKLDGQVAIGLECTGSYAACVTHDLQRCGWAVREVPANLTRAEARRRRKGKCDPDDALAIARIAARSFDELPTVARQAELSDLKLLVDHHDQLVRHRTKLINRLHKDLVWLHPGYEKTICCIKRPKGWDAVIEMVAHDTSVRAELIRERIYELRDLKARIDASMARLKAAVAASETSLTGLIGIGVLLAARILGETGDIGRFRSSAAFASMAGTAPVPVSSGKTDRHRLNRHGNRSLNYAIHMFALVSYRRNEESRAYVQRKMSEGKSFKDAMRCLKRQLTNVIYRTMIADEELAVAA